MASESTFYLGKQRKEGEARWLEKTGVWGSIREK